MEGKTQSTSIYSLKLRQESREPRCDPALKPGTAGMQAGRNEAGVEKTQSWVTESADNVSLLPCEVSAVYVS